MPGPYSCPVLSFTTKTNKVDLVDAAHINAVQTEIAAINNRLLNAIDSDGTILNGTSFPSPATLTSQQFWRTDLGVLYIWTGSQWSPQSGIVSYTAGDYFAGGSFTIGVNASSSTPTKVLELYIPRSGTLRIKFHLDGSAGTCNGRIYRNDVAVGTSRSTAAGTGTNYSEDISGWVAGDLCQIYVWNSSAANDTYAGGLLLYEGAPDTITRNAATYAESVTYTGAITPTILLNDLGNIGDLYILTSGGASTTLYVKTAATTWTAK